MRFSTLIPLLAAVSEVAVALPNNPQRAQDVMSGPQWSDRMDSRVEQFRGMYKDRNDGKAKNLRPPSERKLDDKVDNFKIGNQRLAKRDEIMPGAATAEGFFKYSQQCGVNYCPAEAAEVQRKLDGHLHDLTTRGPNEHDMEFLRFAGLKVEEVTPRAGEVVKAEGAAMGLGKRQNYGPNVSQDVCVDFTDGNIPFLSCVLRKALISFHRCHPSVRRLSSLEPPWFLPWCSGLLLQVQRSSYPDR